MDGESKQLAVSVIINDATEELEKKEMDREKKRYREREREFCISI